MTTRTITGGLAAIDISGNVPPSEHDKAQAYLLEIAKRAHRYLDHTTRGRSDLNGDYDDLEIGRALDTAIRWVETTADPIA